MSALDAAFLSVKRAGHDTSVLDGLRSANVPPATQALVEEAEAMLVPFGTRQPYLVVAAVSGSAVGYRRMTTAERERLRAAKARHHE